MKSYSLEPAGSRFALQTIERPEPQIQPGTVVVSVKAASLNYRDLLVLDGRYGETRAGLVPLSDAAGEVAAVGPGATRFAVGDRVAPTFFRAWVDGPFRPEMAASALGGGAEDGVLAEQIVVPEAALAHLPDALTFEAAACLPCAGLTAWHALVERGGLREGQTVLVLGTGGVSVLALQIARAMGARVLVTSSSDDKIANAVALGAEDGVNYRAVPDWEERVLAMTGGHGVDHVVETGGPATFARSLACVAAGGKVHQIGVLTGFGPEANLLRLQLVNADIHGINVGSRTMLDRLVAFMAESGIEPAIGARFRFRDAPAAYEALRSGAHVGKIVIAVPSGRGNQNR